MKSIKYIFFALCLSVASVGNLHAQDVLDQLAEKVCGCINNVDSTLEVDALQMQLGLCMLREAMPFKKEIKKKYNIDLDKIDREVGQKLGALLGPRLIITCPDQFSKLMPIAKREMAKQRGEEDEEFEEPVVEQAIAAEETLEGNIIEIKGAEFATVVLKDASNREQKLLWLDYFTNAELLKGNLEALKASKVKVWYTEREIYNVQLKDYIKYKVITRLELKQ